MAKRGAGEFASFHNLGMTDTVNADPAELAKFSELAHRWWDQESEFRPLHEINPLRLEWIDGIAPEQPASFDIVTCMEMLEHVPEPASVVKACAELVKPGGWVFFSTIHRNLKAFMLAIVGAEYVLGMLPRGTHEYQKLIRPSELAGFCRAAGLDIRQTRGLQHNPLTRRYWLNDDTSVNYMLATRRAPAAA